MSGIKKVLLSGAALLLVGWSSAQAAQPPAADPPSVSRLSPASSPVGATVVIGGSNFGVRQGSSTVTFNGTSAGRANGWTAANIIVTVPRGATTGDVVVMVGGMASNGALFTVTARPRVTSVSPTSGAGGVDVTISGSGFGAAQETGTVWLGSRNGTVESWSDTQIVATVASNAMSGTVQVHQGGAWSNSVPFKVATATISSVAPSSGVPGTLVTIEGSGFGSAQEGGKVWLGSVPGEVQSWSDSQIVALVGARSASGHAVVLHNGVMSNAVPFALNSLHLTSVRPTSAAPGLPVTFTGAGFGDFQGTGKVWLGGTEGQVVSWSDRQVVAMVAPEALTGIARVQQDGVRSNAVPFTVPGPDGLRLEPALINMSVGDEHPMQAVNAAGRRVMGLNWASSDPAVAGLSMDDPPVLKAVAAGHVTITAGTASADVTIWAGEMPEGTVLWMNSGTGSGAGRTAPGGAQRGRRGGRVVVPARPPAAAEPAPSQPAGTTDVVVEYAP